MDHRELRIVPLFWLLLLLLTTAVAGAAAATGWLTSVDEARARAAERDAYILVDLYADWCGWCKVLEREVFPSEEFRRFAEPHVLLRVDVEDGADGSELQARYGVSGLPTTLILDPRGALVGTVPGYAPAVPYVQKLRAEISRWELLLELFEAVRQDGDDDARRDLAETLHERGDGRRAAVLWEQLASSARPRSPEWTALHARLADARRLAGDYAAAHRSLERARGAADDPTLVASLQLLHARIARDAGDCEEAERSLETFLRDHPRSPHRREARRALGALRRGDVACG